MEGEGKIPASLSDVFERITDAFFALDRNFCYTYVNKKAAEITSRNPASLIGKSIWSEFPEDSGSGLGKALQLALEKQQYISIEVYYPKTDRWFENHIYPSEDGLSVFFKNITEKKKTDLALKHVEETAREIMNSALDAIICIDAGGIITLWTPQAERIFGWKKDEIIGKKIAETIIPVQYREQHLNGFRRYFETGEGAILNKIIEITALNKQGEEFPIELSVIPLSQNGQQFFCAFIRDISARKKAETELKLSEKNLHYLLSSTAENFYVIDKNYCVTLINDVAQKNLRIAWGHPIRIGTNIQSYLPDEKDEPVRASFEKVFRGEKVEYELQHSIKEFPEWIQVNFTPVIDDSDAIIGACVVTKDITTRKKAEEELRKSEERYRSLIEQASDTIIITDTSGNFINANTAFCRQFGYSKEELNSLNISQVIDPEELKNDPIRFDILLTGKHILRERRMMRKDRTIVSVEANVKMLPDGRLLAIARDITERKKAEEELMHSYEQIRLLASHIEEIREDEKIRIAREIHDELGQQLTGLKMDISWIQKQTDNKEEANMKKIKEIQDLLDETIKTVRRISAELRPGILDDLGLVAALEWQSQEFQKRSGIKTQFQSTVKDLNPGPNISTALFRIFQESLTNVARHAHAKKISAKLKMINDQLILEIADDGKGFDVNKAGRKKTLGLLGMKERSLMIGGEYEIKSHLGEGTTVTVSVPVSVIEK